MVTLARVASLKLSAASGLVLRGRELWVVADDEHELHRYSLAGDLLGRTTLLPGPLPADSRERKRMKPDFEALTELPDGSLLALGSCSTPRRERGLRIGGERIVEIDLGPLSARLGRELGGLNIEGAVVAQGALVLMSRKTGISGTNAMVALDLEAVMRAMTTSTPRLEADWITAVHPVDLGAIAGAPLGFTDATVRGDCILFSAVAERTDDPVEDGACEGCVLGAIDARGRVLYREAVSPLYKIEGIACGEGGDLYAVADADDRNVAAPLLRGRLAVRDGI